MGRDLSGQEGSDRLIACDGSRDGEAQNRVWDEGLPVSAVRTDTDQDDLVVLGTRFEVGVCAVVAARQVFDVRVCLPGDDVGRDLFGCHGLSHFSVLLVCIGLSKTRFSSMQLNSCVENLVSLLRAALVERLE